MAGAPPTPSDRILQLFQQLEASTSSFSEAVTTDMTPPASSTSFEFVLPSTPPSVVGLFKTFPNISKTTGQAPLSTTTLETSTMVSTSLEDSTSSLPSTLFPSSYSSPFNIFSNITTNQPPPTTTLTTIIEELKTTTTAPTTDFASSSTLLEELTTFTTTTNMPTTTLLLEDLTFSPATLPPSTTLLEQLTTITTTMLEELSTPSTTTLLNNLTTTPLVKELTASPTTLLEELSTPTTTTLLEDPTTTSLPSSILEVEVTSSSNTTLEHLLLPLKDTINSLLDYGSGFLSQTVQNSTFETRLADTTTEGGQDTTQLFTTTTTSTTTEATTPATTTLVVTTTADALHLMTSPNITARLETPIMAAASTAESSGPMGEVTPHISQEELAASLDVFFLLTMGLLVLSLAAGLAFLEVGTGRARSSTLRSRLASLVTTALAFWAVGYMVAYSGGNDFIGFDFRCASAIVLASTV